MAISEPQLSGASMMVDLQLVMAEDFDDYECDRFTRQLCAEIRELDVEDVALARTTEEVAGAKVADPVSIGAIVVALSASGGVLVTLIDTVREWLGRRSAPGKVAITIDGDTIEIDGATADERSALLDAYLRRHAAATG